MKERPILMSAPMVRASLDDTKRQTRRVITSRKHEHFGAIQEALSGALDIEEKNGVWRISGDSPTNYDGEVQMNDWETSLLCPYGKTGDRLWVKETWQRSDMCAKHKILDRNNLWYLATDEKPPHIHGWRPSIFMPRWASRITLEIESVRVERLNDISEADAKAEGCQKEDNEDESGLISESDIMSGYTTPQSYTAAYARLWESINGKGSWALNPWVWVIAFRKVEDRA